MKRLTDKQYTAFSHHAHNLYNAMYYNVPPVFSSRADMELAENELFSIYRDVTGYTLDGQCDTCRCDNWKALARVFFAEQARRAAEPARTTLKTKKIRKCKNETK